jgi:TonB family protein
MMLTWMLSALLFGACVALVAASAEPFARALGRPTRWIWSAALATAALWPVVASLALLLLPSLREPTARLSSIRVVPDDATLAIDASLGATPLIVVLVLWALASIVLGVRLVRGLVALRRLRAAAERRMVDGVPVLLHDGIGPATIGLRRHEVLVPPSVLELEEPLRRLVLRHEAEHRAARDPLLLLGAGVAVTLFPWNAALWMIARRVRLAIETDCDARVLDAGADPDRYGRLLLLFARHQRAIPLALTLAAPPSHLERRIIAMHTRLARPRPLQLAGAAALLAIGIVGACSAGAPDAPPTQQASKAAAAPAAQQVVKAADAPAAEQTSKPADAQPARQTSKAAAPSVAPTENGMVEFQLTSQAKQIPGSGFLRYPVEMRRANREGEVLAQFVVDATGAVEPSTYKVLKSDDPAFSEAVREALPTMRFTPARIRGKAVKQLVEQPFTFSLSRN